MVLSNGTARAKRASSSAANNNQGGGDKKPGLFPSVGRDSWTNVAYGNKPGRCMTLGCIQTTRGRLACTSRPVGSLYAPRFSC